MGKKTNNKRNHGSIRQQRERERESLGSSIGCQIYVPLMFPSNERRNMRQSKGNEVPQTLERPETWWRRRVITRSTSFRLWWHFLFRILFLLIHNTSPAHLVSYNNIIDPLKEEKRFYRQKFNIFALSILFFFLLDRLLHDFHVQ